MKILKIGDHVYLRDARMRVIRRTVVDIKNDVGILSDGGIKVNLNPVLKKGRYVYEGGDKRIANFDFLAETSELQLAYKRDELRYGVEELIDTLSSAGMRHTMRTLDNDTLTEIKGYLEKALGFKNKS